MVINSPCLTDKIVLASPGQMTTGYGEREKVNDQEQIQALVDKTKVIITEDSIRSDLCFDDAEGTAYLLNEAIFEGLVRMGYEKPSQKLTFYKAYFFPQSKFLIHTILQCLSAKTTAWNKFNSTMASAIICLADNQKFNFSKYIFDNMVKSLEGRVKFYLFPRFLQVLLDKQVEGMTRYKEMYVISSHTKKIFTNMRIIGAGFSGVIIPLFDTMMVQAPTDIETSHDESEDEDHVPTPSSDPLPSGEDISILNELMVFYTSLQEQVLDLQEAKAAQANEVAALKKKKDSLGAQEDASKQGRMIKEIDQNAEIALDDETQGRTNDDEMFGVDDHATKEVVIDSAAEPVTIVKDSVALTTYVTEDEITMAQALAALKSVKTKVVDKGKAKMIEPEVLIKKKEHMRIDKEYARKLEAEEQRSFDEIKKLYDREMTKVDENVEPIVDDSEELRMCIEIVFDDGDKVLIEGIPISSRSPTIIDYKIYKEGKKTYFKIFRANGNSQVYQTFEKMFKNFNKEDLEVLWDIAKDRFKKEKPVDDMDNILFRTLKTMFEHHVKDTIWKYQQGLAKGRIVGIKSLQGVTAVQVYVRTVKLCAAEGLQLLKSFYCQMDKDVQRNQDKLVNEIY
nr:hypothetical protein [Tanacetum cinerariifolium]